VLIAYKIAKLIKAWARTKAARRSAELFIPEGNLKSIVEQCRQAFRVRNVEILSSRSLRTAATIGIFKPAVILPQELLRTGDENALTAAVGHELAHIARRDYLLNLIYEMLFLPLSFHPAAALIKRRIIQTRELRCDEVVAERLLHPDVYARTLVRLAGLAMPFASRAQTISVGIIDADILEVRIMSLLKKTKLNLRRKAFLLIAAAILLAIPGVVAASFAVHFKIDPGANAQEPLTVTKDNKAVTQRAGKERLEKAAQERQQAEREMEELRQRIEKETSPVLKAELMEKLKNQEEDLARANYQLLTSRKYAFMIDEEGQRRELELKEMQRTELARLAKINMDQAIQIANSKAPGKVLECSLMGEHWEGEGENAKPGLVLYHVVVLSGDESNSLTTHVWVNAVDGGIFRTEKEERRRERPEGDSFNETERKNIEGGGLNGRATSLPQPEYPSEARQAGIQGVVEVQITIDQAGNVIEAKAVSGHPLLRSAAVDAAREAKFQPTRKVDGTPVQVQGTVVYRFSRE